MQHALSPHTAFAPRSQPPPLHFSLLSQDLPGPPPLPSDHGMHATLTPALVAQQMQLLQPQELLPSPYSLQSIHQDMKKEMYFV